MRVLQVNSVDIIGRRFNGYDLNEALRKDDISAKQMVVDKYSNDDNVIDLSTHIKNPAALRLKVNKHEYELSFRGMLFPYGKIIVNHTEFKKADIVHYHLIYNDVLSLADFAELTRMKPSLMSIHDCSMLTGHCVHPMDCRLFETGCAVCPDLERQFSIKDDKAALMWSVKKRVFSEASLELIVGSRWMLNMVKRSPITSSLKTHFIPFGIDVEFYSKQRKDSRKRLGIPEDAFVLFFRAQLVQKGLQQIMDSLELMEKKPYVITCQATDCFKGYAGRVKEFGLVKSDELMADLFAACDVFLMPSTGESFGFMAVECMASGKPIIVADGTALPDVTFAPDCGISVPQGDAEALKHAIEKLRECPEEREKRGRLGQKLAREHYRFENYYRKHKELYTEYSQRRSRE